MISVHLPVLQVVIALMAAPVCVLLRRPRLVWFLTVVVNWSTFAMAVALLQRVIAEGTISYAIGGWAAPWGIEYRLDLLSAFLALFLSGITAVVISSARVSVEREIASDRIYLFYCAYLLFLAGLLGVVITGDAFNLFVFVEISSLASYALVSLGTDRRALLAAFQYLILGTIGATFILIGIGFLYMLTGTLNIADLAARLPHLEQNRTLFAGFAFLTIGTALKLALFPLHLWLPDAYTYAPAVVSTLLAATSAKVFVYVLLRFGFSVLGTGFAFEEMGLGLLLMPLASMAALVGSMVAIYQRNVKRLLAYSSIAQIGYMVLGVSFVSVTGLTAAIVHLFNHALIKGTLFLAMGCVSYRIGSVLIEDMKGLSRDMPWTMGAFVVGGLSLIGVPLTVGFVSKWYLVLAALERGWWPIAAIVLISSLLAVIYIWRVVEVAYFHAVEPVPSSDQALGSNHPRLRREAPWSMLAPTWLLIAANFYFGTDTSLTVGLAGKIAETLLGTGS